MVSIILHGVLSVVAAGFGLWAYKKRNKEMALLCAGAQPSIAIALSLWDLGSTFGSMTSSTTDGVYQALSLKMYHMVGGIGLGVFQEIATSLLMPEVKEEKYTAEDVKNDVKLAVMTGVKERLSEIDQRVRHVSDLMAAVPGKVEESNTKAVAAMNSQASAVLVETSRAADDFRNHALKVRDSSMEATKMALSQTEQMVKSSAGDINNHLSQVVRDVVAANVTASEQMALSFRRDAEQTTRVVSEQVRRSVEESAAQTKSAVNQSMASTAAEINAMRTHLTAQLDATQRSINDEAKRATETMRSSVSNVLTAVKHETEAVTVRMQSDLNNTAEKFNDKIRAQTEQVAQAAAEQGGQVIEAVVKKVAYALEVNTNNAVAATAKMEQSITRAEDTANRLKSAYPNVK